MGATRPASVKTQYSHTKPRNSANGYANNFVPTDAVLEIDEINDFVKKRSDIFEKTLEKLKSNK